MRRVCGLWIGLFVLLLAGCLNNGEKRSRWTSPLDIFGQRHDEEAATIQYVVIERPAGGDEINRRAWDQVDEQILSFETRAILEESGLRIGKVGNAMPSLLNRMVQNPRTKGGARSRSFALDRPFPLMLTSNLPRVQFPIPTADGPEQFSREQAILGIEITVKEAKDGHNSIKLVPMARYRDSSRILTGDVTNGDQATESFTSAGVDITLTANEYLVIGTDYFREDTFGHQALVSTKDNEPTQRLIVLWAGLTKENKTAQRDPTVAPPLAAQASVTRGSRP